MFLSVCMHVCMLVYMSVCLFLLCLFVIGFRCDDFLLKQAIRIVNDLGVSNNLRLKPETVRVNGWFGRFNMISLAWHEVSFTHVSARASNVLAPPATHNQVNSTLWFYESQSIGFQYKLSILGVCGSMLRHFLNFMFARSLTSVEQRPIIKQCSRTTVTVIVIVVIVLLLLLLLSCYDCHCYDCHCHDFQSLPAIL